MPLRFLAFVALLFVGVLAHIRAASSVVAGDEGMLWLWTSPPETRREALARYSFYLWVASCFIVFAPIDIKTAMWIAGGFLFAHVMILIARDW